MASKDKDLVDAGDPVDERGHTVADAEAQEPLLSAQAPAASEVTPPAGEDIMVRAQTPEEVQAQIDNVPGEDEDADED